jgi:hypothetical protein
MNAEHRDFDVSQPATREPYLAAEAREFLDDYKVSRSDRADLQQALKPNEKTGRINLGYLEETMNRIPGAMDAVRAKEKASVPGLVEAMLTGKVGTNYTPGVDFIGDKELHSYVEDLIRFYLDEEPIIRNPETYRMAKPRKKGPPVLDRKLLDHLFAKKEYEKYVFKVVDGRGGDGVYIGPKMTPQEAAKVKKLIIERPEAFIAQKYMPLSVFDGKIVDVRVVTQITPDKVMVSPVFWGRGTPIEGDGKVNLSQHGREFAIFTVPDNFGQDVPEILTRSLEEQINCVRRGLKDL